MMYLNGCPYCRQAFELVEQLKSQYPELASIEIETIEEKEHPEIADALDYYYVPTYYVDDRKLHEGVPNEESILRVLRAAL